MDFARLPSEGFVAAFAVSLGTFALWFRGRGGYRPIELVMASDYLGDGVGLGIDTPGGLFVHSGDFKLDPAPVDGRVTDLERFWDHFQGDTLMRVYDHVMQTAEGKPRASDAPHFGELRVDVTLSEPDYQLGVDKEQIASMEALHEEIYFGTLHFFDVLGRLGERISRPK